MSTPEHRTNRMVPAVLGVVALAGIALVGGMAIGHSSAKRASTSSPSLSPSVPPASASGSLTSPTSAPASPATVTVTVTATETPSPVGPPASTGVVVNTGGSGNQTTANFTVAGNQWNIAYTYDCTAAGGEGSFIVKVHSSDSTSSRDAVSELGASGQNSTQEHGSGTYYITVTSPCAWHLTVTS